MAINPQKVTVSGISGGSYMAMQLLVIGSDWVSGANLEIGGSFGTVSNDLYNKYPNDFS